MIRLPKPLAGVSELVARAFAVLGEHDGVGSRSTFGIGLAHGEARRPTPKPNADKTGAGANGDDRHTDERRPA